MTFFDCIIEDEICRLDRIIDRIKKAPPSTMPVVFRQKKGKRGYYIERTIKNGKPVNTYLGSAKSTKLKSVVSKSVKKSLMEIAKHDLTVLKNFRRDYIPTNIDSIIKNISPCLKDVSKELYVDERYEECKAWASQDYEKNSMPLPERYSVTKDGVVVRSKGECIWYNSLLDAGIPFRYDPVFELEDFDSKIDGYSISVSPDFVVRCCDGSMIIIEHAGLLRNDRYVSDLMKKIQLYLQHGYVLGDNLILTSDTFEGGTNSEVIQRYVDQIALRVFK